MRYLLFLSILLACSSPHSAAPRKYGSFLGPGFVQRPDTLAALSAKAAAGDMVQYDGTKWGTNSIQGYASGFGATPSQSALGMRTISLWGAGAATSTVDAFLGGGAVVTTGTATPRTISQGSLYSQTIRIGYVSTAGAGSVAQIRALGTQRVFLGNGTTGGFVYEHRFAVSDAVLVGTANMFVGLVESAWSTDVTPSSQVDIIGVGCNSGDTHLQLYANGVVAQPRVDLGASFPVNTTGVDVYELTLYAPTSATKVYYRVRRLNTGDTTSGVITAAANLPATTTNLVWDDIRSNGGTASAVGIDFMGTLYEESP